MRAIFGHIAAQGVDRYLKGPETEELVDWFVDDNLPLPQGVRFYFWPFPHHGCVLFRDVVYLQISRGTPVNIWVMKFFPLAFLMTFEASAEPYFNLPRISDYHDLLPVDIEMPLDLGSVPDRYWPEAPTIDSMVTFGKEAMFATPHVR